MFLHHFFYDIFPNHGVWNRFETKFSLSQPCIICLDSSGSSLVFFRSLSSFIDVLAFSISLPDAHSHLRRLLLHGGQSNQARNRKARNILLQNFRLRGGGLDLVYWFHTIGLGLQNETA